MNQIRNFLRKSLEKHPLIANSIIYGTLCTAAELSQQTLTKKVISEVPRPIEYDIVGRYSIYGTFVGGPVLSVWYRFLDKICPGTAPKILVKKLLVDQFFFTPQLLVLFYVTMSLMERKQDLLEECKSKFPKTFQTSCLFWLPAQTVNFAVIPSVYRVTYISCCSFAWINILCWLKREELAIEE
nr:unnamed protein product [Callosobruchus chinensis]CAH7714955.1 unnamed protein product [Callosobruchus chinensis]